MFICGFDCAGRRILAALLLAAPAALSAPAALAAAPSEAEEFAGRMRTAVTRFGFEENVAIGPGRAALPREWERHLTYLDSLAPADPATNPVITSDGSRTGRFLGLYPDFLAVEVVDLDRRGTPPEAVHGGRRALRMSLAGSRDMDHAAIKRRIPLEVDPDFAYELTGWVRLENARKASSCAQLGIEWLSGEGAPLGPVSWSDPVDPAYVGAWRGLHREEKVSDTLTARVSDTFSSPVWVPAPEFRINDVPREARAARVWCRACGREAGAWAGFDDLELIRRPKVGVAPDPAAGCGIFDPGEPPALRVRFQGLAAAGIGPGAGRFLRVATIADFFGRRFAPLERSFEPEEIRGGSVEERVRLDQLAEPGIWAVQIALEVQAADGSRAEVARRVVRVVRLAPLPEREAGGAREQFGVEAGLYRPEAAELISAAERLGLSVLAPRLWRPDRELTLAVGAAEAPPEETLEKRLRELAGRHWQLSGVLAPAPRSASRDFRDWRGNRTLFSADPERWSPLLKETVDYFQQYLSAWRLGPAGDRSFADAEMDRPALARRVRDPYLDKAASRVLVVPVPLDRLNAPAPGIDARDYRELVYVPAADSAAEGGAPVSAEGLAARLRELFPEGAAGPAAGENGAGPAAGREWFLELGAVSENLGLSLEAERRQVQELARKVAALAAWAPGRGPAFVELADPRRGLLGPGLYPRPAYAACRTLAAYLTGARFLGEFDLAAGAQALAFERAGEGLLVFWADGPERLAPAQLGARGQAVLVDVAGRRRRLAPARESESAGLAGAEMVPLSPVPAILANLEAAFIRTRLSFRLAAGTVLESRYEPQPVRFEIGNYFAKPMSALVFPRFPQGTVASPRFQQLNLDPGKVTAVEFAVRPSFVETVGTKDMAIDLQLSTKGRRAATFTITRQLRVESGITLSPEVTVAADGASAEVQLYVALRPGAGEEEGRRAQLEVSLVVPGAVKQRALVAAGREPQRLSAPFSVPLTSRPQVVWAGARQRGGAWFANIEIRLPAAGAAEARR